MGYPIHFREIESRFVGIWERLMREELLYWPRSKYFCVIGISVAILASGWKLCLSTTNLISLWAKNTSIRKGLRVWDAVDCGVSFNPSK